MATSVSYDISGDAPIEVRSNPALDAIENIEKLKAEAAAFAKSGDWDSAMRKYDEVIKACDASGELVKADFEAERTKERCYLACLCNRSLCYYRLQDYEKARELAQLGIDAHQKSRVVDDSGLAKCLYRRGQASLGLKDSRSAVDSIAEAVRIEEAQLAKGKGSGQANLNAMKRELIKARRAAKEDSRIASAKLKAQMGGFLATGSKSFSDPVAERRELVTSKIDCVLKYVLGKGDDDSDKIAPNYEAMIAALVQARHEACSAKDTVNELHLTFAEGFVAFVASAPEADATEPPEKYYARCADAMQSYWHLREELARDSADEGELEPPRKLGDVSALECSAHSLMQLRHAGKARPYFEKFVEIAEAAGPQPAYHNLPDSFLLQRGLAKMDDAARRASRWKHRAHSPRALFDARTALCAITCEAGDIEDAVAHAYGGLGHAGDDEERLTAHKNLAYVMRKRAALDDTADEQKAADLETAEAQDKLAAACEAKLQEKKEKGDEAPAKDVGADAETGPDTGGDLTSCKELDGEKLSPADKENIATWKTEAGGGLNEVCSTGGADLGVEEVPATGMDEGADE